MKKLISILFVFLLTPLSVIAKDNPQAMIVFDASGSMWGQVDGKAKITIAKKALNKVVSSWDENTHLGLIAYGHRKKGDCNDIQVLSPIGKINKKGMISKVKKIKPKGKTPISRSIKKAAEALKYTEEKATVILISDGKETCDADPCGTAKALEKEGIDFVAHVIGFDVDKQTDAQLKCIADATGGEYFSAKNASSLNDAMTKIVKKVQKVEAPKPPVIKKLKNNLEISATEKEGGKWVKEAYHEIFKVVDGEKAERYSTYCYSGNENACIIHLPAGQYLIATKYNKYKKETSLELDESVLSKVNVVMGQTGKVEITAVEKEGGKWVKEAYHEIFKVVDGKKAERYSTYCYSGNENACLIQLPVGQYLIASKYNKFKQETPLEVVASQLVKKPIIMGQTGEVEITAVEKEGGKWVKEAYHEIFKVVDGKKAERYSTYCYSGNENACLIQLPVGQYLIATKYNKFKQETPLEVVASQLVKKPIIMGQTGEVEITAVEKEGGKWVKEAYHEIFKVVDGKKAERYSTYCYSTKKAACVKRLPVGQYLIATKYNKLKKETALEIIAGELVKKPIVMGQTGEVEIITQEKEGGKWVDGYHEFFKVVDGKKEDRYLTYCSSNKKQACKKRLPAGSYIIGSKHKNFRKQTNLEITAGKVTKINIVFSPFSLSAKCNDMNAIVLYEIYASNGQLIFEGKSTCSKSINVVLKNGNYNLEAKVGNDSKELSFSIGDGQPNTLSIDLHATAQEKEESHDNLIKADSTQNTQPEPATVPAANNTQKPSSDTQEAQKSMAQLGALLNGLKQLEKQQQPVKKPSSEEQPEVSSEMDEARQSMAQLGAVLGGIQQIKNKPIQAFKESVVVSLPLIEEAKVCYENATDLAQVKPCEALEETAIQKSQAIMQKSFGQSADVESMEKHSEWNDAIKKTTVQKAAEDIKKMKLSIVCIDKGADFSNLKKCIDNEAKFKPKKSEIEQMGNLLKALGNIK